MLSMSNITEVVDAAKQVANSISEVYNLQEGNNIETMRNTLFKKSIIKEYANVVEWNKIDQLLEDATREAPKEVNKMSKLSKIDENIQNPEEDNSSSMGMDMTSGGMEEGGESDMDDMSM